MSIEPLEPRITPAALTAKLFAGVLKISGDPTADDINITQNGTSIEVLDGATSLGTFQNVKSLDVRPEGGNVTVAIALGQGIPGPCKIAAKGATTVSLAEGSVLTGGLTYTGDLSPQDLIVGDHVIFGKGVTYKPGLGADKISIGNGVNITGNLTLAGVEDGDFIVTTSTTTITGSLIISNAGNSLPVILLTGGAFGLTINGGITYTGGKVNDSVFLNATVTKSVVFTDMSGDNGVGFAEHSAIHGSITVTGGIGNDSFNLECKVDGNVTLKFAGGNNTFTYGSVGPANIAGNLFMSGGDGNDRFQNLGGTLKVGKNLTMQLGNGTNSITAGIAMSGTKLAITTGSGVDTVFIGGTATAVAAIISLGAGADLLGGGLIGSVKSANLNGGAGIDRFAEVTLVADPIIIRSFEDFS